MARIDDVMVSGTFGNIVFYRRMGKPCARLKRENIKQTEGTKKRGTNFGIAARAGKILRKGLIPAMPNPKDRSVQSRFSGAVAKWLGQSDVETLSPSNNLFYISNFPFTDGNTFKERCRVAFEVNQTAAGIRITLAAFSPAEKISAPAGTLSVQLIIAVAAVKLSQGIPAGFQSTTIVIPFNQDVIPEQVLDFPVSTGKGNLIVTAARLIYTGFKNNHAYIIEKKNFNPAGVIDARLS